MTDTQWWGWQAEEWQTDLDQAAEFCASTVRWAAFRLLDALDETALTRPQDVAEGGGVPTLPGRTPEAVSDAHAPIDGTPGEWVGVAHQTREQRRALYRQLLDTYNT